MKKVVRRYWKSIFEELLDGWRRDADVWPRGRNIRMSFEWFDVQLSDMVFDFGLGLMDYE